MSNNCHGCGSDRAVINQFSYWWCLSCVSPKGAKPIVLAEVRPQETDVRQVLEHALTQADGFEGVMVLALKRDGTQWARGSTMSAQEKAFLLTFHQALMNSWFCFDPESRP